VQSLGLPQTSGKFIFLSRDNGIEAARTATFGLRQLAFPDGGVFWAVLKEHCDGPWNGGFVAVDQAGNAFSGISILEGVFQWTSQPQSTQEVRSLLGGARVVYDTSETRTLFEQRWPFLKTKVDASVLSEAPAPSAFKARRLANEITLTRVIRLSA